MNEKYFWLNKDSRKFLERGYLLEGETAEQRIRQIAETAESFLKINGFADKFEDYVARGYYSLSSPISEACLYRALVHMFLILWKASWIKLQRQQL